MVPTIRPECEGFQPLEGYETVQQRHGRIMSEVAQVATEQAAGQEVHLPEPVSV